MILYNVTINIDEEVHDEWFAWLLQEHIPELLQTGLFVEYKILRLLSQEEESTGATYAIQYYLDSIEDFLLYNEKYAGALREKTQLKYGSRMVSFRTLLEVIK